MRTFGELIITSKHLPNWLMSRVSYSDRRYQLVKASEKAYRLHISRYGVKISLKNTILCINYRPLPF